MPRKGIVTTDPLYWMPVNVQEWLSKLAGSLTTEQFGGAVLLLFTSWHQQPPCTLPADPAFLAQRSGLGARWAKSGAAVLAATQFYLGRDGRLHAEWLATVHKEQLARYEHRSAAGKANRAKREQHELELVPTGTDGRTNRRTIGRTNRSQKEKGEGVPPTGVTPDPEERKAPDAPAPEGARAGSVEEQRGDQRPFKLTDILVAAGVPRE